MGKKILASIMNGNRYCFKGESTMYFRELFNTEEFIRVLEFG